MTTEIKIIAGLVGLALFLGLTYWGYHSVYAAGLTAGRAEIQSDWNADKQAIATLADAARVQALAEESAARDRNQGVLDDLQHKIDASLAAGNALAERLRDATTRLAASRRAVPKDPGGPAAARAGGAGSPDELTTALGATFAECARNADRLDALIAELQPQI